MTNTSKRAAISRHLRAAWIQHLHPDYRVESARAAATAGPRSLSGRVPFLFLVCALSLIPACGLQHRLQGVSDLTPDNVRETDTMTYAEACGEKDNAGILIDFNPSWEAVVELLPSSARSVWAAPDGYIVSSLSDELTEQSVVGKFRLDEGRVISCE